MTEGFHELLARDVAAFGEERVLARRIMIERRPRHAEFARDILERRLAEAEVAEHARRGAQHFDPAVSEAIVGTPARLGAGWWRHASRRCPACSRWAKGRVGKGVLGRVYRRGLCNQTKQKINKDSCTALVVEYLRTKFRRY